MGPSASVFLYSYKKTFALVLRWKAGAVSGRSGDPIRRDSNIYCTAAIDPTMALISGAAVVQNRDHVSINCRRF